MADAIWFLFSSSAIVWALAVAAIWVLVAPRSRTARRFLAGAALAYWIASSWVITHGAASLIALGYHPLTRVDVPAGGRTAVVLLGSSSVLVRDWSENHLALLDSYSAARTLEAARVFRLIDPAVIVSSGGTVRPDRVQPAGWAMSDELVRLGVPADRILIEIDSRTTRDEAVIVRTMLAQRRIDHVVLVTSAVHMRRSIGAFRAVGLDPIPAIARDPVSIDTWWGAILPSQKGFEQGALAAHEALGLVWYVARGWFRF
ncbi:MAG: YdcF family protein [Vicinamibacterales bacterium]